ncbi:MAG: thioredoxin domain-containing protein [Bacteroidota bacterium]
MKKVSLIIIGFICLIMNSAAVAEGIKFHQGSLEEAMESASQKNTLFFVDAYADWCGPCKYMSQEVFTDPKVASIFNRYFVSYKMDMESQPGKKFAQTYPVDAYPTLFILDAQGKVVEKSVGALDSEQLIHFARRNLSDALEEIKADESLLREENWNVLTQIIPDVEHPSFQYVLNHQTIFEEQFGQKEVDALIKNAYYEKVQRVIRDEHTDFDTYTRYRNLYSALFGNEEALRNFELNLSYYIAKEDAEGLLNTLMENTYHLVDNPEELDGYAWFVYENFEDTEYLLEAKSWIEKSISIEKSFSNLETYAAILTELGQNQEARRTAEEAIDIRTVEDDTLFLETLLLLIDE